jgi:hypothetical protein
LCKTFESSQITYGDFGNDRRVREAPHPGSGTMEIMADHADKVPVSALNRYL